MKITLIMMIFLSASLISPEPSPHVFIVWNTGQGQWATQVGPDECRHFDMGGEFFPWNQIQKHCGRKKQNVIFLSHWDWDHIGALAKAPRYLPNLCMARRPVGPGSARKEALIPKTTCSPRRLAWEWHPSFSRKVSANDLSQVFLSDGFLIPGDSTSTEEKVWAPLLPTHSAKYLVLGHHGSKTSSSDFLFTHLPNLRMAVSTARWQRYHHPHPETLARLHKYRIPLLRTEDWGSLHFEL